MFHVMLRNIFSDNGEVFTANGRMFKSFRDYQKDKCSKLRYMSLLESILRGRSYINYLPEHLVQV